MWTHSTQPIILLLISWSVEHLRRLQFDCMHPFTCHFSQFCALRKKSNLTATAGNERDRGLHDGRFLYAGAFLILKIVSFLLLTKSHVAADSAGSSDKLYFLRQSHAVSPQWIPARRPGNL